MNDKESKVIKDNTKDYNQNKLRVIPKCDIEMIKNDYYEETGIIKKNKNKQAF